MDVKLEKMGAFFDARVDGYDEHQLLGIASAEKFYPFTASLLPGQPGAKLLDLGCGTGLELQWYLRRNPRAEVTGIDLAPGMLDALKCKFPAQELKLILGSYFDVPFGEKVFDAVVSVESLHHFTQAEKIPLYKKVYQSLKTGGCFVLTDYFSSSDEEEAHYRGELLRLKTEQGISDDEFYHFDTPLTVAHELDALTLGGFERVEVLKNWGATHTLRAVRC